MLGITTPHLQDQIFNKSGIFIPNYLKLSDVTNHSNLIDFFNEENPIPDESSLMILNVNFRFVYLHLFHPFMKIEKELSMHIQKTSMKYICQQIFQLVRIETLKVFIKKHVLVK